MHFSFPAGSVEASIVAGERYRWVVLAVGTAAQAAVSASWFAIAILAPDIRSEFDLSLTEIGVVLAAFTIGMTPTLLPWGLLADRIGERVVLPVGLGLSACALACVGIAPGYAALVVLLAAAGALSASVNAASGRAVMHWFAPGERGLALGIRQANVPIGGLLAALLLPALAAAVGLGWTFAALGAVCFAGAVAGAVFLRDPAGGIAPRVRGTSSVTLRRPALWRISWGSGLIIVGQTATMSFTVLFLHEARGFSIGSAALVLAASQLLGGVLRVVAGGWSDRLGSRIVPLCRLALGVTVGLVIVALVADAPSWVLVPVLVLAGAIGLSWNGLSFVAAAEVAGAGASGAALGFQQTVLGIAGIAAPILIAALVSAASWQIAFLVAGLFPLLGWALMHPLAGRRPATPELSHTTGGVSMLRTL